MTGKTPAATVQPISSTQAKDAPLMAQDLSSPEWITLGETISHMADITNPSEGAQRGLKEGFVAVRDILAESDPDGWSSLRAELEKLSDDIWARWGFARGNAYIEGYLLAQSTAIQMVRTFAPVDLYL